MTKLEWGEGREAFFLLKQNIETELRKGRSKRAVFLQFEGQLKLGYRGFNRLVERYIGPVLPGPPTRPSTPQSAPTRPHMPMERPDDRTSSDGPSSAEPEERPRLQFTNTPDSARIRGLLRRAKPKE